MDFHIQNRRLFSDVFLWSFKKSKTSLEISMDTEFSALVSQIRFCKDQSSENLPTLWAIFQKSQFFTDMNSVPNLESFEVKIFSKNEKNSEPSRCSKIGFEDFFKRYFYQTTPELWKIIFNTLWRYLKHSPNIKECVDKKLESYDSWKWKYQRKHKNIA